MIIESAASISGKASQVVRRLALPLTAVLLSLVFLVSCGADAARRKEQAGIHTEIGSAYITSGDYAKALKELLEAKELDPGEPKIHYYLAMAYAGQGFEQEALRECREAISLNPDYSEAHNYLGTLYLGRGQAQEAIASFRKALANILYETPAVALYNMGRAYAQMNDYTMAMDSYRRAAERDQRGDILPLIELEMGRISCLKGDYPEAFHHLAKSLDAVPNFLEARYVRAECYRLQGRLDKAREEYKDIIRLAPSSEFAKKAREVLSERPH